MSSGAIMPLRCRSSSQLAARRVRRSSAGASCGFLKFLAALSLRARARQFQQQQQTTRLVRVQAHAHKGTQNRNAERIGRREETIYDVGWLAGWLATSQRGLFKAIVVSAASLCVPLKSGRQLFSSVSFQLDATTTSDASAKN